MKVIFVAPKANIPEKLISKLEHCAKVLFFEESPIDIRNISALKEKGEKILCPFPEPMDTKFPNEFIKKIPDLKAICLSTTSYSWVDGNLARSLNIPLSNVPNPPNGVAEGAIFMMFALARRYAPTAKEDRFEFIPDNLLQEIRGKSMGIIGMGNIGTRIAELGTALGMKVFYWSRRTKNKKYEYFSFRKLLKNADFIFPTVALNEETKNMLTQREIDLMKKTASLISIVPEGIIDRKYLIKKVGESKLFGFAFEEDSNSITEYKGNVFVTCHNNWYTKETLDVKMEIWINNIVSVIKTGKPINVVN